MRRIAGLALTVAFVVTGCAFPTGTRDDVSVAESSEPGDSSSAPPAPVTTKRTTPPPAGTITTRPPTGTITPRRSTAAPPSSVVSPVTPPLQPCHADDLRATPVNMRWSKPWVEATPGSAAQPGIAVFDVRLSTFREWACTVQGRVDLRFLDRDGEVIQRPGPTPKFKLVLDDSVAFTVTFDACIDTSHSFEILLAGELLAGGELPLCDHARVGLTPIGTTA